MPVSDRRRQGETTTKAGRHTLISPNEHDQKKIISIDTFESPRIYTKQPSYADVCSSESLTKNNTPVLYEDFHQEVNNRIIGNIDSANKKFELNQRTTPYKKKNSKKGFDAYLYKSATEAQKKNSSAGSSLTSLQKEQRSLEKRV